MNRELGCIWAVSAFEMLRKAYKCEHMRMFFLEGLKPIVFLQKGAMLDLHGAVAANAKNAEKGEPGWYERNGDQPGKLDGPAGYVTEKSKEYDPQDDADGRCDRTLRQFALDEGGLGLCVEKS